MDCNMFAKNLDHNVFFKFRLQCKINMFKSTLKKNLKNVSKNNKVAKAPNRKDNNTKDFSIQNNFLNTLKIFHTKLVDWKPFTRCIDVRTSYSKKLLQTLL